MIYNIIYTDLFSISVTVIISAHLNHLYNLHSFLIRRWFACWLSPALHCDIWNHCAHCDSVTFLRICRTKGGTPRWPAWRNGNRLSACGFQFRFRLSAFSATRWTRLALAACSICKCSAASLQHCSMQCSTIPTSLCSCVPLSSSQLSQRICLCAQAAKSIVPCRLPPAARAEIRQLLLRSSENLTTAFTLPLSLLPFSLPAVLCLSLNILIACAAAGCVYVWHITRVPPWRDDDHVWSLDPGTKHMLASESIAATWAHH